MPVHTNNVPFRVRREYDIEYTESNELKLSLHTSWESRDGNKNMKGLWDIKKD